jgi:hypothetical protein
MIRSLIVLALVLLLLPVAYAVPSQVTGVNALRANSAALLYGSSGLFSLTDPAGVGYGAKGHSVIYTATSGPWSEWGRQNWTLPGSFIHSIEPGGSGGTLPGHGQGGDPVATIPEPATMLLFGLGLLGLGTVRRLKRA